MAAGFSTPLNTYLQFSLTPCNLIAVCGVSLLVNGGKRCAHDIAIQAVE